MPLHLAPRQRRMLQAILRAPLWLPGAHGAAAGSGDAVRANDIAATPALRPAAPSAAPTSPSAAPAARAPVERSIPIATPRQALVPSGERPEGVAQMDWPQLQEAVAGCRACGLCAGRNQTVFGVGDTQADWLVVGEAPGEQEDRQGEPFVGQAGQLLNAMLAAMQVDGQPLARGQRVYIANVLKCRPPGNRNPEPAEMAQCQPFLQRQIELLQPKIILAMGRFAVQSLLQSNEPIGKLRGRVHHYQGVPLIVTYHPAYLLRNLPDKAKAWADLCLAMATAAQVPRPAA